TFQPSPSDRALAMMRARMSGGVLADAGTRIRMTFEGKDCANADPKTAPPQPIAAAPAKNSRLFMALPFVLAACPRRLEGVFGPAPVRASSERLPQASIME